MVSNIGRAVLRKTAITLKINSPCWHNSLRTRHHQRLQEGN